MHLATCWATCAAFCYGLANMQFATSVSRQMISSRGDCAPLPDKPQWLASAMLLAWDRCPFSYLWRQTGATAVREACCSRWSALLSPALVRFTGLTSAGATCHAFAIRQMYMCSSNDLLTFACEDHRQLSEIRRRRTPVHHIDIRRWRAEPARRSLSGQLARQVAWPA